MHASPAAQDPAVGGEGAPVMKAEEMARLEEARQAEEAARRDAYHVRLSALAESLAKTRSEAISGREASGIEEEWLEDEEFYVGIDDANRHEYASSTWRKKPMGEAAQKRAEGDTRSTVFPNITGPYTDAAAARIADMLLPTDDRPWGMRPTPMADLVGLTRGKVPGNVLRAAAKQFPGRPDLAQQRIQQTVAEAMKVMAEAKDKAERAQTVIEDWHVECQYHSHVRQVIEDCARIGTGVLKGPFPETRTSVAYDSENDGVMVKRKIAPVSKVISPWNFYPDPACGENIHNGSYTWERDSVTAKQLRDLKKGKQYLPEQIDVVLQEGPHRAEATYKPELGTLPDSEKHRQFEIWYFHGALEREHLEALGVDTTDIKDPSVPAQVTMVNNRIIRLSLNPLDTGDFPYDVMVWSRRPGHWAGVGVARKIRVAQRIVTAATRNLMDNAGIASGPMLVFREGIVRPANGKPGIAPRKVYYISESADEMVDATKAIGVIKVDMLVAELLQIINLGLKLAEDVTGLPMILQGQQGKAPDTVGGMQMLNNNANAVLRRMARLFDDRITEPHVRRYYVWLLMYHDDMSAKGDFQVDARGSSALVERDIQNQELAQLGAIVTNPVFGKDPKKWLDEYLKSRHLDPKRFEFDDEKWQEIVANLAKGPQDPRLAVAQLRADLEMRLTAADQAFTERENARDRELEIALKQMDTQVDTLGLSVDQKKVFDQIRARLGETVIKINNQRAMQREANAVELSKPPVEPAGRAADGKAYIQ